MGYDSLIHDYSENELQWSFFMIVIGFANEVHPGIIIAYATAIAKTSTDFDLYDFALFLCFVAAVPVLARTINARWWLGYNHQPRI